MSSAVSYQNKSEVALISVIILVNANWHFILGIEIEKRRVDVVD